MKGRIAKIAERFGLTAGQRAKKKAVKRARGKARLWGQRGPSANLVSMVCRRIIWDEAQALLKETGKKTFSQNDAGVVIKRARPKMSEAMNDISAKAALNRMGIINTEKDQDKVKRIQGIVQEVFKKTAQLMDWDKPREEFLRHPSLLGLQQKLVEELGSKRKMKQFLRFFLETRKEVKKIRIDFGIKNN